MPNEQRKNKGGRPPAVTSEVLQKLKEAFLMGCTDAEACLYSGISQRTLYNYQEENEEFLQQKDVWKQRPFLKARQTIYMSLGNTRTAQWFMEKRNAKEFSQHVQVEIEDPIVRIRRTKQLIEEAVARTAANNK